VNHFCYKKKKKKKLFVGIGINVLNLKMKFSITNKFEVLSQELGNEKIDCVIEKEKKVH